MAAPAGVRQRRHLLRRLGIPEHPLGHEPRPRHHRRRDEPRRLRVRERTLGATGRHTRGARLPQPIRPPAMKAAAVTAHKIVSAASTTSDVSIASLWMQVGRPCWAETSCSPGAGRRSGPYPWEPARTPCRSPRTCSRRDAGVRVPVRRVPAADEIQASASARSTPASLLHRYEKAEDELAPLLATSISKLRRLRELAVYMGYCAYRWKGHMRRGTHEGRTLSRRRRLDMRTARRRIRD